MTFITLFNQNTNSSLPNTGAVQIALEVFADEALDVSAKGIVRAYLSKEVLSIDALISFLAPRDYDVPVRHAQLEQIRKKLEQVLNGGQ